MVGRRHEPHPELTRPVRSTERETPRPCPVAAVTDGHRLGGSKQHRVTISRFWKGLTGLHRGVGRAAFLWETLGKNLFPGLSRLASRGHPHSCRRALPRSSKPATFLLSDPPPLPAARAGSLIAGVHVICWAQIILDNLSASESFPLITAAESLGHVRSLMHGFLGIRPDFFGGHCSGTARKPRFYSRCCLHPASPYVAKGAGCWHPELPVRGSWRADNLKFRPCTAGPFRQRGQRSRRPCTVGWVLPVSPAPDLAGNRQPQREVGSSC